MQWLQICVGAALDLVVDANVLMRYSATASTLVPRAHHV